MAKRTGVAVLFHPKKKTQQAQPRESPVKSSQDSSGTPTSTPGTPSTPSPSQGSQPPTTKRPRARAPRPRGEADDDGKPHAPEGPFTEYRLLSSALNGWKYDVLKFDSRKPVDIAAWEKPVKLNRKDFRRGAGDAVAGQAPPQAVGPMLGPDGKPVIGMDGRVVMVDAEGRPIRPAANGAAADGAKGKEKEKPSAAKKKFQKKTKQVFLVPDAVRQLRREERYPWVMEDGSGKEVWVGSMEEVAKAETQAMFMPAANDVFKFVPAHRWYKFQKKPNYHIPSLEEAESLMSQIEKNKDPERWLLRRRNGQGPSEATAAMFKSERAGSVVPSGSSLVYQASQSYGPGGRRLKTVDSGMAGLFGDDDEEEEGGDRKRKLKREYGQEGDLDELDFEESFQDDEEKPDNEAEDEEEKELEERLKREYKTANKMREGYIDESEEEEETPHLSGAGKAMRKLMKKLEKNTAYDDSDEEKNPYASSEEEEEAEEEVPPVPQGPAIIPPEPRPSLRAPSQVPGTQPATPGTKTPSSTPIPSIKTETGSRATSPVPVAGHGGHSIVAKRATSPKVPKLKPNGTSRAGSPLAGGSPTSPVGGTAMRAESPPTGGQAPSAGAGKATKRKAEDGASGGMKKKRKSQTGPINGELEDWMLVEWLKNTPTASTRDCIHHFTPYLTNEEKKQNFTKLVKEVAQLKGGVLVLRAQYRERGSAGAPSPSAGGAE